MYRTHFLQDALLKIENTSHVFTPAFHEWSLQHSICRLNSFSYQCITCFLPHVQRRLLESRPDKVVPLMLITGFILEARQSHRVGMVVCFVDLHWSLLTWSWIVDLRWRLSSILCSRSLTCTSSLIPIQPVLIEQGTLALVFELHVIVDHEAALAIVEYKPCAALVAIVLREALIPYVLEPHACHWHLIEGFHALVLAHLWACTSLPLSSCICELAYSQ